MKTRPTTTPYMQQREPPSSVIKQSTNHNIGLHFAISLGMFSKHDKAIADVK